MPEVTPTAAEMPRNKTPEQTRRTNELVASLTQSHHEEDQPKPMPKQTPYAEPVTEATADAEQTIHPEPVTPEPTPPSTTPISDPTLPAPSILHIFYDA